MKSETSGQDGEVAEGSFVAIQRTGWRKIFKIFREDHGDFGSERIRNQANVGCDFQPANERPRGGIDQTLLARSQCQSPSGADRFFERFSRVGIEAGRNIDRQNGPLRVVELLDEFNPMKPERTVQTDAEKAVDQK